MRTCLLIIAFGYAWGAMGQTPIATISSGKSFEVGGVRVPVAGLPSWPLMAGDIITTGDGPAVISFGDRGRLVLNKNSKLQLESVRRQPSLPASTAAPAAGTAAPIGVVLMQGAVAVKSERGSGVRVTALDQTIHTPPGSQIAVGINGNRVLTGPDASSIEFQIRGTKLASPMAAAKPKPTPTPTPTPPPPPSPK